ncbi:hypothetical protein [Streptomyces alfalfae]|uniref:hypothetical protein n=1 Tax=Streptomyces alfalfae TaxID=1642299 RepID=UPI00113CC980|nr:hypothetical protein [Streptomyces alfalfae]THC54848.1 hypothetical protein E7X58_00440 [Streptomyces sp. A1499]
MALSETEGSEVNQNPPPEHRHLLTPRAALVILFAVLTALGVGALTVAAGQTLAEAVLAGGGALGGALLLFNQVIGNDG